MFSLDFENNIYQKLQKYSNNFKKILVEKLENIEIFTQSLLVSKI